MTVKDAVISGILVILVMAIIHMYFTKPRITFVLSDTLVNEYSGMKEARQAFSMKQTQWQTNLDSLKVQYRQASNNSEISADRLNQLQQNVDKYAYQIQLLSEEEDQKMTQTVLEQINNFVEIYGEREGYDIILGSTSEGSILYGRKSKDITQEILQALNEYYMTGEYE